MMSKDDRLGTLETLGAATKKAVIKSTALINSNHMSKSAFLEKALWSVVRGVMF